MRETRGTATTWPGRSTDGVAEHRAGAGVLGPGRRTGEADDRDVGQEGVQVADEDGYHRRGHSPYYRAAPIDPPRGGPTDMADSFDVRPSLAAGGTEYEIFRLDRFAGRFVSTACRSPSPTEPEPGARREPGCVAS